MTTRARFLFVPLIGLLLLGAACDSGGSIDASPSASPTPAPSATSGITFPSGIGLQIDVDAFLACLSDGGIEVEPEDDPRFSASTELQIGITTSSGFQNVGVFIYPDAQAATTGKTALDHELDVSGSAASTQVGNVLVTDASALASDSEGLEKLGVLVGCLI
ncbi:MAG: hypothetical protein LC722_06735 [Actinobacteria bacterium]|nr:hypothetical protein [Actinomycetota bacterium]